MTRGGLSRAHDTCGATNRAGEPCGRPAGWGTPHPGSGRCKLHGGSSPVRSGRYSAIKREELRALIEQHEADPDPLNIYPELAAARALFQDFIERYDTWRDALVAWHQTFRAAGRPVSVERVHLLERVLDEYEALLRETSEPEEAQEHDLEQARAFLDVLAAGDTGKPMQILDIADAHRIVSEITKIVERIERIRSANAISRPELLRVMAEMGRVVEAHVDDAAAQKRIKEGWLAIRVA